MQKTKYLISDIKIDTRKHGSKESISFIFYKLLNHFLFLKNKFAFFESAVVSWRYLMSMNLNQAHFRLFVAVIILQKILRTKSVLPDMYNFQTAHSTLACLNSKLKVHFWVIFLKSSLVKTKAIWQYFSNSGIFGNTRSKVVDVAPNPHLNQVKRPYAPVWLQLMASALVSSCVAGYWLDPWARSFRFSMTGRYGTRYAAPSLSRPKCCFSPFASQFWKDSCSVKNRSSEKLFWFFMWNLKKERCFTRLENDWGSNSGKKAKLFFSFVKIVSFSVDWKFWKKFLWLVVKIMMFWQKKTFVSWRKKLELNKYEKVWCFFR